MPIDKPWERQQGESSKAFEAFVIYRDMGADRTLTAVAEKLQKSYTLVRRWKERWRWPERVRAYDNDLEKAARAKAVKDRKDMISRHIKIATDLQDKACAALKNMDPQVMSPKDIKEILKMATDLERLNREIDETESGAGAKENNLLEALQDQTMEDIDTDDLPELQQTAESDTDMVE